MGEFTHLLGVVQVTHTLRGLIPPTLDGKHIKHGASIFIDTLYG